MMIEEFDYLPSLQEEDIVNQIISLNKHVISSLRKKGIKLREFRWSELEAS